MLSSQRCAAAEAQSVRRITQHNVQRAHPITTSLTKACWRRMATSSVPQMPWRCMSCAQPLPDDGDVQVFNANPDLGAVGSYPHQPSPDDPPWSSSPEHLLAQDHDVATFSEVAEAQVRDALWLVNRPKNIDFGVYHTRCDPHSDLNPYRIPAVAGEYWLAWVYHIAAKTWVGKWDLLRLLSFYWRHRDVDPPPL